MTPTEAITALEKALEAGPTQTHEWRAKQGDVFVGRYRICSHVSAGESLGLMQAVAREHINAAYIAAANPLAIRTLLDAHAGALRDAELLDWLETQRTGIYTDPQGWIATNGGLRDAIDAARAALATNTKAQP